MQDWYEILQVSPNADREIIQAAYRRLSRMYHPDVDRSPDAMERQRLINAAYTVLSNPSKRKDFDRERQEGWAPEPEDTDMNRRAPGVPRRRRTAPKSSGSLVSPRNLILGASTGVLVIAAVVVAIFVNATGDDGGSGPVATPLPEDATADDFGAAVSEVYLRMFAELEPLVAGRPDPASVSDDVEALHDRYIEEYAAIGWQVNDLPEDERPRAQFSFEESLFNLTAEQRTSLQWYPNTVSFYQQAAPIFAAQLEDFNTLTRYAFFDQLRMIDPEEADRLGVP